MQRWKYANLTTLQEDFSNPSSFSHRSFLDLSMSDNVIFKIDEVSKIHQIFFSRQTDESFNKVFPKLCNYKVLMLGVTGILDFSGSIAKIISHELRKDY